jgi:hypothetical protein
VEVTSPTISQRSKYLLIMLLKALLCLIVIGATCVFVSGSYPVLMAFFFPSYLSPLKTNYNLTSWLSRFQLQFLFFLLLVFGIGLFYKGFICFQFHYLISIYQILYSPVCSSFLQFLIFIIDSFVKNLVVFNFTIQIKLTVLCFSI